MAGRTTSKGSTSKLTDQQILFCQEYARSLNLASAYKAAGYKVNSDAAARAHGSRLVTNGNVQAYLKEVLNLDEVSVINAVTAIALTPITEVLSWDGRELIVKQTDHWSDRAKLAVKKIKYKSRKKVIESRDREVDPDAAIAPIETLVDSEIEIEMYDRLAALDKLMRKLKLFPKEMQTIECVSHLAAKGLLLPGQAEAIINGLNEFEERLRSVSGGETTKTEQRGISEELAAEIRSRIMGIDAESASSVSGEISQ